LLPSDVAALFELLPAAAWRFPVSRDGKSNEPIFGNFASDKGKVLGAPVVEGSAEGTTAIAFAAVELPFALVSCILSGEARDGGFCPDPVFVEAKGGDAIPSV